MRTSTNENAARGSGRQGAFAPVRRDTAKSTTGGSQELAFQKRIEAALRVPGVPRGPKAVLFLLAYRGEKSWPSIAKIASDLSMSRSSVIRAIRWLEKHDWLTVHRTGKASRYFLNMPRLCQIDTSSKFRGGSPRSQGAASDVSGCNRDPDLTPTEIRTQHLEHTQAPVQEKSITAAIREIRARDPQASLESVQGEELLLTESLRRLRMRPETVLKCWRSTLHRWSETGQRPMEQFRAIRDGLGPTVRSPAAVVAHRLMKGAYEPHAAR